MKYWFLDTSAFAKLYVVERGMTGVRDLLRTAERAPAAVRVMLCDLVLPEAVSAVVQMQGRPESASRGLSRAALRQILPRIRAQFAAGSPFDVVPASGCMELASELAERHRIRGADSVQLAAALRARAAAAAPDAFIFVSDDGAQCRAAEAEGLLVLRPAA